MTTEPAFTGPASLTPIAELPVGPVKVASVSFPAETVTFWHSHEGGQVLHVVEGMGRYRERGAPVRPLASGDVVVAAPGVEHWHGAAADADVVHIAVSSGVTTWGDAPDTAAP